MLSPHEQRLVDGDRALPGMSVLLDTHAAYESFQVLAHSGLEGLRRLYVRYKPGVNLLVGYGRGDIVECYAKAYRSSDTGKIEKAREKAADGLDDRVRLVAEDIAVSFKIFPEDAKLRRLGDVVSDRGSRQVARLAGVNHSRAQAKTLRYKPERRYVGCLLKDDQPVASFKSYTDEGFERAQRGFSAVTSEWSRASGLLAIEPRLLTILHEWAAGTSLHELLLQPAGSTADLQAVGAAIARLHTLAPYGLPQIDSRQLVSHCSVARSLIEVLVPDRVAQIQTLADRVAEVAGSVTGASVSLHGDLNAEQVIIGKTGPRLIDFDRSVAGPSALDLATFAAHLELDALAGPLGRDAAERTLGELLEGYRAEGGEHPGRLPALTAVVLFQLAATPFRRGESNWHEALARILERCEELLDRQTAATSIFGRATDREPIPAAKKSETSESVLLARALDADHMSERFSDLNLPAITSVRMIKRRVGRRFVVEYAGKNGLDTLVGKVRIKGPDRKTHDVLVGLHDLGCREDGVEPFAVPEPVGLIPEMHMSLARRVGRRRPKPWMESRRGPWRAERIGRSLARLHNIEPLTRRRHTHSDELGILSDQLNRYIDSRPEHAGRVAEILGECERLVGGLPWIPDRGIHRDFHPENLIVDGEQVFFIDFDLYAIGDPAIDVGNFVGHIVEHAVRTRGDEHARDEVSRAFVRGYLEAGGPCDEDRIGVFSVVTLARHIHLSTVKPGRSGSTGALIEVCERLLEETEVGIPAAGG